MREEPAASELRAGNSALEGTRKLQFRMSALNVNPPTKAARCPSRIGEVCPLVEGPSLLLWDHENSKSTRKFGFFVVQVIWI